MQKLDYGLYRLLLLSYEVQNHEFMVDFMTITVSVYVDITPSYQM
jgi:hypothetical protein